MQTILSNLNAVLPGPLRVHRVFVLYCILLKRLMSKVLFDYSYFFSELIDCSLSIIDANTTVDEACDVSLYHA